MQLPGALNSDEAALFTDLYELTMAQSYFQQEMHSEATFSLFVRPSRVRRPYLVSAGLEDVLRYLRAFRFAASAIDYLRSTGIFAADFLEFLSMLRFTGRVRAVPEGRLFFHHEPVLEVTAPIIEAQLIETLIINQVNLQCLIATKAARCTWAAQHRFLFDFSLRRAHGADAGMKAARSSHIAGFASTSNVLAGKAYGLPLAGTMAHSYVSSFEREIDAFRAYAESFPNDTVLLIDTYDTIAAAHKTATVGLEMQARGLRLRAVRLDSGDLLQLSREVRRILDDAGLDYVRILASGGLDEYALDALVRGGAPIDAFGVGTRMAVSGDAPWLDAAYKLVQYAGRPVLKLSSGKASLPGEKQVFRLRGPDGRLRSDVLALASEPPPEAGAEPLLQTVMERGEPTSEPPSLPEARERFRDEFAALDDRYKRLSGAARYPVRLSRRLLRLRRELAMLPEGER